LSRRRFLQSAATAAGVAAGAAVLPAAPAAPSAVDRPESGHAAAITLKINGVGHDLSVEPRVTLLDALRERLGLVGTKKGCGRGQCGACTVLVNGRRINSCLTLAIMHVNDEITTIEGLEGTDGTLHPVQAAFLEHDAFQCGYCTPGQIVSAVALLEEHRRSGATVPLPDAQIRERMSGNICRCGAYPNIVAAVREAAAREAAAHEAAAHEAAGRE
jgi:xanthine dehydrogenase YagT iron-sulfur-binding subunit